MNSRSTWFFNAILLACAAALIGAAFLMNPVRDFTATDDQARQVISQLRPEYTAWVQSLWQPDKKVENLLFAFQAILGASFIGYYLYRRSTKKRISRP